MPLIKSAIKRVRQEQKRRSRNLAAKRRIRIATKQTHTDLVGKDLKSAQTNLKLAISHLDKAVKKGTLHRNTANRRKAQLARAYNSVSDKPFGTEKSATTKKAAPAKTKAKTPVKKAA